MRGALTAGSWRGPSRSTAGMLAVRERTGCADLRCSQDGDGRRSGALFGAQAGVVDRRLGCGRRHGQLWLPSAVLFALRPGQAASVLVPAPGPHVGDARGARQDVGVRRIRPSYPDEAPALREIESLAGESFRSIG